ncbi:hypothetical protein Lcho_1993 [Leptothrix cholodnii SP-6]|uniref:Uncharacterized protein n=1 Tax=Leptothrix cholodnii (strain ATCC 51168 / LMG 8142 / SP-6) TaxID=395495 RepID=B1Y1G1_LEPCP|nr:hypothetical protein Lcho_1993 [Leptothrix cholodnii SP-6]
MQGSEWRGAQPAGPAWRRCARTARAVRSGRQRRGSRAVPRRQLGAQRPGLGTMRPGDRLKRRLDRSCLRGRDTGVQCGREAITASGFTGECIVPIGRIGGRRGLGALILRQCRRTAPGAQDRGRRCNAPRVADRMAHGRREQAHQDEHDAHPADPSVLRAQALHGGDCRGICHLPRHRPFRQDVHVDENVCRRQSPSSSVAATRQARADEKKPGLTAGFEGTWKAGFHEVPRRQPVTQPVCTVRALE